MKNVYWSFIVFLFWKFNPPGWITLIFCFLTLGELAYSLVKLRR